MMQIAPATKKDLNEILKFAMQSHKMHKEFKNLPLENLGKLEKEEKKTIAKHYKDKNSRILTAKQNKEIAGYMILSINNKSPYLTPKKRGYIEDLYIKTSERKKGIGKKLFAEGLQWFKKNKVSHITLSANTKNKKSSQILGKTWI